MASLIIMLGSSMPLLQRNQRTSMENLRYFALNLIAVDNDGVKSELNDECPIGPTYEEIDYNVRL